ncbi:MAG: cytochrome c oxidase subunit II [Myxococcales bacterium]|nr:cytochrome c oxidase subunit II [Myxococcales bacterium]USN50237.1 MAG: cytochrome c oxidase subunit II [Myxococcales bacterium]
MENLSELLKMVVPVEWLFSVMPEPVSDHAAALDSLFWFLVITCSILFLSVIVPMVLIIFRYRRKKPHQRAESQKDHNFWLESAWTFLPFIYLTVLFVWGFKQYIDIYVPPHDAMELRVVGQKWQWSIDYPKDEISVAGVGTEVYVPVNTPVKLVMSSQDVIHSFFIPNLRIKQDVVPGSYTTLWFNAHKPGTYPILCAEYCGDLHSQMLAKLVVVPANVYSNWVEQQKAANLDMPLPELGKKLYTKLGCVACHSIDGSIKLAPSFKDLYGRKEELSTGAFVTVNDEYIRQSILTPQKQITKGFPPIMPTFQGRVNEREISGIIAYIKSLSN